MFDPIKREKRFCVDYKRLNARTVRDTYPLLLMEERFNSLEIASIFFTND